MKLSEMNDLRAVIRDKLTAGGKIDLANATLIKRPATYAIPVEHEGMTYFVKVDLTVAPWYDTKSVPAFDLDAAVAKLEATDTEKVEKAAAKPKKDATVKAAEEASKEIRRAAVAAMTEEVLSYVQTLTEPQTSTEVRDAVPAVAGETIMFVGSMLKKLAEAGEIEKVVGEDKKNRYRAK